MGSAPVLAIEDLRKTFKVGFSRKIVEAVRGISFTVHGGDVFGFLGPNGAGKTTTIKVCMDLIRPSEGSVRLFGQSPGGLSVKRRIGYLPEAPYFYDYLRPTELLDFFGKLYGVRRPERKRRIEELLEMVGLCHARDRTLRKFSKGMLQRFGVAQALIGDPDLVVLDEPLSGLDPIGRKELKDIILAQKQKGKTVFFSSHILSDIELLCDRIVIIDQGKLKFFGPTQEFVNKGRNRVEIIVAVSDPELVRGLQGKAEGLEVFGNRVKIVCTREVAQVVISTVVQGGGVVESVIPRTESLEELFVRTAKQGESA